MRRRSTLQSGRPAIIWLTFWMTSSADVQKRHRKSFRRAWSVRLEEVGSLYRDKPKVVGYSVPTNARPKAHGSRYQLQRPLHWSRRGNGRERTHRAARQEYRDRPDHSCQMLLPEAKWSKFQTRRKIRLQPRRLRHQRPSPGQASPAPEVWQEGAGQEGGVQASWT